MTVERPGDGRARVVALVRALVYEVAKAAGVADNFAVHVHASPPCNDLCPQNTAADPRRGMATSDEAVAIIDDLLGSPVFATASFENAEQAFARWSS